MKSSDDHLELIRCYLTEELSGAEVAHLEALMLRDPQLRADFLAYARVDAALPRVICESQPLTLFEERAVVRRWSFWVPMVATLIVGILLSSLFGPGKVVPERQEVVARFGQLHECRWIDAFASVQVGDPLHIGQRVEFSSGFAELIFESGTVLELVGPVNLEVRSANSGFLAMGEVHVVAETAESKGFELETPITTFIDIGTEFSATVSPDSLSRLEVTKGEVDVIVDQGDEPRRFNVGETLYIEPGARKVLTRIESGDQTAAFRFPTIEAPSSSDFAAGRATIQVVRGVLNMPADGRSYSTDVLLDGKGQLSGDSPLESASFASQGQKALFMDLGQEISVSKVNTYSWHQHPAIEAHRARATQHYTLYGFTGEGVPDFSRHPGGWFGWQRIARVNSDEFFRVNEFLERPAQQACSITAARGDLGRYRYLLWVVSGSTFFGEFDVYGEP
jgi:hypothetical protein